MGVPHYRGLRRSHSSPAFQRGMVLVGSRLHHFTNIKRFLAPGVGLVRQDLADSFETAAGIVILVVALAVRIGSHVTIGGIGSLGPPWKTFAGGRVGMIVVAQQNVARFVDIASPVLRLAVDTHDAVVTADALIVLGRNAAREFQ